MLLRSGPHVFGGATTCNFLFESEYSGTNRCFLFSVDHDMYIPFSDRVHVADTTVPALYSDIACTKLRFGGGVDLQLEAAAAAKPLSGRSTLEFSYGLGMSADLAEVLLAGKPEFKVDEIEIWQILY